MINGSKILVELSANSMINFATVTLDGGSKTDSKDKHMQLLDVKTTNMNAVSMCCSQEGIVHPVKKCSWLSGTRPQTWG